MRTSIGLAGIAAAGFVAVVAQGAEPPTAKACVAIKENAKRLACFDAAMKAQLSNPQPEPTPAAPPPPAEPEITTPLEIKGLRIGSSDSEVRSKFASEDCKPSLCIRFSQFRKAPNELDTFAGGGVKSILASFSDNRLVSVYMTMPINVASLVVEALTEKYGKGVRSESEYKTKGGLTTTKLSVKWVQGDARLQVDAPAGQIDEMTVTLRSEAYAHQQIEEMKGKALKDL